MVKSTKRMTWNLLCVLCLRSYLDRFIGEELPYHLL